MFEMFITVWLIIGAAGVPIGQVVSSVPQTAAECMADADDSDALKYVTGMAVMNRIPFTKIEATCAVYDPPGEDA